jgi:hypothetical protein
MPQEPLVLLWGRLAAIKSRYIRKLMKLAILGLLSCLCLSAQQAGAGGVKLEGIAVDAVTQAPLAGVHISLISMGAGTNLPEPDAAYGAISNAAGHYSMGNIRPGTYVLEARHAGFVYVREDDVTATPTITLKAGEQNSGYRIAMTPEATIIGHVVDEFGDPLQGVGVRAVSVADVRPYGLWTMSDATDDRGEYRISGIPGKYFIEAAVRPLQTGSSPEIRTDGSSTTAYATTYYPGSLAKERAKVVEAVAGQELAGIDIHVAHRKRLKISGTVTGMPAGGDALPRATVTIRVRHDNGEADDSIVAAADGSFEFAGLAPSEYRLQAAYPSRVTGGDSLQSPVVKVTIENDDATVTLPVTAGEVVTGTLRVEGDGPVPADPGNRTVRLTPLDYEGAPTKGGQVAADGSFAIGGIIPGVFRLIVDPLPENAYIKSLVFGGAETLPGDLDLSKGAGGSNLKVIVSRNGGQITGTISDKNGLPLNGRRVFVVLAADANSFATWQSAVTSDSTFAFHGIRPGKYRLFAVDPLQFGQLRSYEPLKAVAARAEELEVKEGDRIAKGLRTTGKDVTGEK